MANLDIAGIITRVCTDLRAKFSKVTVTYNLTSGTKSATLTVDDTDYDLYAPTPPKVSVTQSLSSGTQVGSITVDGTSTTLYAPTPPTNMSELTNDSNYINSEYLTNNFQNILDDTQRESFYAADSTTAQIVRQAFGAQPHVCMPSGILNGNFYLLTISNNRGSLIWQYGTILEVAPIRIEIDMSTQTSILYATGRYSVAYGTLGVDDSWTIEALPENAEGVSY